MYLSAITKDLQLAKSCKLDKYDKFLIRSDATDLAYLVDFKDCLLIKSNYRNPLAEVFKRTPERKNKATSRSIELDDLPKRFAGDAALELIEQCSRWRGEDKKPRQMHPNSLKNLRPLVKGCKALPRVYSAPVELTERAEQLRACGHSLRATGDVLGLTETQVKYLLQGSPSRPRKTSGMSAEKAPATRDFNSSIPMITEPTF